MAITQPQQVRDSETAAVVRTAVEVSKAARGGWVATTFSAVAVALSCISVYVSTLQAAQLEVYLPQAFQYALDGEGENFTIPITIANSGARSSTVLSIELEVQNTKTNATRRFYGAYMGEYPRRESTEPVRQFTPLAVLGRTVFSETVRFYPVGLVARGTEQPRIISGTGEYTFRLKVNTAAPAEPSLLDRVQGRAQPAVVSVSMTLPVLDHRGTMQLRAKDWAGAAGTGG